MATVLITGGTGLIGKELGALLVQKGYHVIVLSRSVPEQSTTIPGITYAKWDVAKQFIDVNAVQQADYIIHLAGAGVAEKRWTEKRKKEIVSSRIDSSALLVKTLQANTNKVRAVVSSSAIGWYGPDPVSPNPKPFIESDASSQDFLGATCKLWEESIEPVVSLGKRLVKLRTGIVLSKKGGALKEFETPLKFGLATVLGSGKQIISWIHIDDICRMYLQAIEDEQMHGAYNAVTPAPLSNKHFILQLAKAERNKFFIPVYVPSFVLKLMLGEMSIEVLKSTTVSAAKIKQAGFNFVYPSIEAALNQLTQKEK